MRVAVIEIGSRSVRLLVADVEGRRVNSVLGRTEDLDLMQWAAGGRVTHAMGALTDILQAFRSRASTTGAMRVFVYGTEAVRRITADFGRGGLERVHILDPAEEARSSLTAAALQLSGASPMADLCAIDHGNGSLEVAFGDATSQVTMSAYASVPLGSEPLLARLAQLDSNLGAFRSWAHAVVDGIELPASRPQRVVIQGSVATKCAWLTVRRNHDERYEPRRVDGRVMERHGLAKLWTLVASKPPTEWAALSRIVNPRDPPTDQIQRLATGCIVLERLLQRLDADAFTVGAYGARYGMAWRVAHGDIEDNAFEPASVR